MFFFHGALPSFLFDVGAKGTFRKILGSVSQKWIYKNKNSTKRRIFGSTEILRIISPIYFIPLVIHTDIVVKHPFINNVQLGAKTTSW